MVKIKKSTFGGGLIRPGCTRFENPYLDQIIQQIVYGLGML